jgi:hypothetical protein
MTSHPKLLELITGVQSMLPRGYCGECVMAASNDNNAVDNLEAGIYGNCCAICAGGPDVTYNMPGYIRTSNGILDFMGEPRRVEDLGVYPQLTWDWALEMHLYKPVPFVNGSGIEIGNCPTCMGVGEKGTNCNKCNHNEVHEAHYAGRRMLPDSPTYFNPELLELLLPRGNAPVYLYTKSKRFHAGINCIMLHCTLQVMDAVDWLLIPALGDLPEKNVHRQFAFMVTDCDIHFIEEGYAVLLQHVAGSLKMGFI